VPDASCQLAALGGPWASAVEASAAMASRVELERILILCVLEGYRVQNRVGLDDMRSLRCVWFSLVGLKRSNGWSATDLAIAQRE
jgi:hypothetical protein